MADESADMGSYNRAMDDEGQPPNSGNVGTNVRQRGAGVHGTVQPVADERAAAGPAAATGKKEKHHAKAEKAEPTEKTEKSTVQDKLRRWQKKNLFQSMETRTGVSDARRKKIAADQMERVLTQLPQAVDMVVLNEACKVLDRVQSLYSRQIGKDHPMSLQARDRYLELRQAANLSQDPTVSENKSALLVSKLFGLFRTEDRPGGNSPTEAIDTKSEDVRTPGIPDPSTDEHSGPPPPAEVAPYHEDS